MKSFQTTEHDYFGPGEVGLLGVNLDGTWLLGYIYIQMLFQYDINKISKIKLSFSRSIVPYLACRSV